MKKSLVTAGAFLCLIFGVKADFTRTMVCRWTFNAAGEAKALTDDVSGFKLIKTGAGKDQTMLFNKGMVELGSGTMLAVYEINSNSEKFSGLKDKITIWMRFKFASKPNTFFMGLLDSDKPADWGQQTFTAMVSDKEQLRLFATNSQKKHFGFGSKQPIIKENEFVTLAICYDRSKKTVTIITNDKAETKNFNEADALASFRCLAVGKLKVHLGLKIVIDELRVYNSIVPPEWISEIEPVKESE
ncbi:MAG: hypothetical protein JXR78_09620 [Victivallales bacterium]|nr:hypothetical protein [Victivallales bacterium]